MQGKSQQPWRGFWDWAEDLRGGTCLSAHGSFPCSKLSRAVTAPCSRAEGKPSPSTPHRVNLHTTLHFWVSEKRWTESVRTISNVSAAHCCSLCSDTVQPSIQLAVTCHRYVQLTLGQKTVPKWKCSDKATMIKITTFWHILTFRESQSNFILHMLSGNTSRVI